QQSTICVQAARSLGPLHRRLPLRPRPRYTQTPEFVTVRTDMFTALDYAAQRRRFLVSILVLVVLTAAVLLLVRLLAPPADKQLNVGGFFQIKVGMPLSEVEE